MKRFFLGFLFMHSIVATAITGNFINGLVEPDRWGTYDEIKFVMTDDKCLEMGGKVLATKTTKLAVQDDGNVVISSKRSGVLWALWKDGIGEKEFYSDEKPDRSFCPGDVTALKSIFQKNGQMVFYTSTIKPKRTQYWGQCWAWQYISDFKQRKDIPFPNKSVAWSTSFLTPGAPPFTFIIQQDGNVAIYDKNELLIWTSNTHTL
jgi:hypothetical protein